MIKNPFQLVIAALQVGSAVQFFLNQDPRQAVLTLIFAGVNVLLAVW